MTNAREAWIIDGVRTPRGKGKPTGALHHIHPQELLAQTLGALVLRVGFDPSAVEDVIIGNGNSVGDHGACIGRLGVLAAGWPQETPGFTLNRFCGSGQQAVTLAAMGVISGMQDLVIGGGVESMSRWPVDGDAPPTIDGDNPALREKYPMVPQGISADLIASLEGFTREQCDDLAVTSQTRAAKAIAEGRFDSSMIAVRNEDGSIALDVEEHPRAGTTLGDIGLWEINEAFAAVVLKAMRELDLDPEKVNVDGGAMALGHPIGATGGILIETALDELERSDKETALIVMCTGGGMGTATIIERI